MKGSRGRMRTTSQVLSTPNYRESLEKTVEQKKTALQKKVPGKRGRPRKVPQTEIPPRCGKYSYSKKRKVSQSEESEKSTNRPATNTQYIFCNRSYTSPEVESWV